jgi:ABC-2 type transport system permease protein
MAATNTEIYRRFQGTLRPAAVRFLPLAQAGIRTASKRKLPLVLLYAPPTIATVIFSFVVYVRFSLMSGVMPGAFGGGGASPAAMMAVGLADTLTQVRMQIVGFHLAMTTFTFLILAWFGAGLIAEDRRLGAHLLYFARPLTRLDYLLGKFLTLAFFGSLAVVVPGLVICTVAAFSSPEWSFLKQEGDLVAKTVLFGLAWVFTCASAVLAISSLCTRKSFALVASFTLFLLPVPIAQVLAFEVDPRFHVISLQGTFLKIAASVFDAPAIAMPGLDVGPAYMAAAAFLLIAWIVLAARVRRMLAVG